MFWDDRGWFVEALDRSGRPVDSLGSNPGHALWTGIADADHANRYLDTLVGDQLWKGAALNGIQIAESLAARLGAKPALR